MSFKDFIKDEVKVKAVNSSSSAVASVNYPTTYSFLKAQSGTVFDKALNEYQRQYGKVDVKIIKPPIWNLFATMYKEIPSVSAGIKLKESAIAGLDKLFKNRTGHFHPEVSDLFQKTYDLKSIIKNHVSQMNLFGTVIDVKFKTPEGKLPFFKQLPANDIRSIQIDKTEWCINNITWNSDELGIYDINLYEYDAKGNKDRNFFVSRTSSIESQFFGDPPLESLYTTLDMKLQNDINYQQQLLRGFRPVTAALVGDDVEQSTITQLQSFFEANRDPDTAYNSPIINVPRDENGNPSIAFAKIESAIQNRLSLSEQKEIDGEVYDNLSIPRIMLQQSESRGVGANEYEPAMEQYKNNCIDPQTRDIEENLNSFVIPEGLRSLEENGIFEHNKIMIYDEITGEKRIAKADDFVFCFGEFNVETLSAMKESWIKLGSAGGALWSEVKVRGRFVRAEDELNNDDYFRTFPRGVEVVKQGALIEGVAGSDEGVSDEAQREIEEVPEEEKQKIEKKDYQNEEPQVKQTSREEVLEIVDEKAKAVGKSGKKKKRMKKFFSEPKVKASKGFSRVPELLKLPEAVNLKKNLKETFDKQYKSLDIKSILRDKTIQDEIKNIQALEKLKENMKVKGEIGDLTNKIINEVKENTTKIAEFFDIPLFANTLQFYSRLGVQEGINQAKDKKLRDLEPSDVISAQKKNNDWITGRTMNLLEGKPEGEVTIKQDPTSPYYEGSLDETTYNDLAEIIAGVVLANPNASESELLDIINDRIDNATDVRADLTTENNSASIFNQSILALLLLFGEPRMRWLRTTAKNPREVHLAQVGEIRKASDFPELPGTLPRCQCSWELVSII